jgi:hypothetical protein
MAVNYGLTVDQGVARLMLAERITDEAERRAEYRKILGGVRALGYGDGGEEERVSGSWS